jgi:hypothetical protein
MRAPAGSNRCVAHQYERRLYIRIKWGAAGRNVFVKLEVIMASKVLATLTLPQSLKVTNYRAPHSPVCELFSTRL